MKIIAFLLIPFLLSGCSFSEDYTEPENLIIVTALGIDSADENIMLTVEALQNSMENTEKTIVYSAQGADINGAVAELQNKSFGKLFLGVCPVVIFGESVKSETLKEVFNFFAFENEIPFSAKFAVCRNAKELLSKEKEKPAGYEAEQILKGKHSFICIGKTDSLCEIMDKNFRGCSAFCFPFIEKEEQIDITGLFLYEDFSFLRSLDLSDSKILFCLMGKLNGGFFTADGKTVNILKSEYKDGELILKLKNFNGDKEKTALFIKEKAENLLKDRDLLCWLNKNKNMNFKSNIKVKIKEDIL